MSLYSRLLRPLLFQCDPEFAHHLAVQACRWAGAIPPLRTATRELLTFDDPMLRMEVAGLRVANPLGLAAGWDKSGQALPMLGHLGFGFAEIGSVSAEPSAGNPRPRLFRLPLDKAIVVNYGLPNDGATAVARRLNAPRRREVPIGVNIVKTNRGPDARDESDETILADYLRSVELLQGSADYLTLNLSCPNAQGGKEFFSEPRQIGRLMGLLANVGVHRPLFLKITPNPDPAFLDGVLQEVAMHPFVKGFMFNLPTGKPPELGLNTPRTVWGQWPGAVAGKPCAELMNTCIRALYQRLPKDRYSIVGVGGVFSAADAYEKIQLGASLVQVFTALIYDGPGVVARINEGLCELLARDGLRHVREAIGQAV